MDPRLSKKSFLLRLMNGFMLFIGYYFMVN